MSILLEWLKQIIRIGILTFLSKIGWKALLALALGVVVIIVVLVLLVVLLVGMIL
jgi:hypothetical protein